MSIRVRGAFSVKITPQTPDAFADGAMLGRMTIEKQIHGELNAASKGQMLTAMTAVDNILAGRTDKANIWEVNTEMEYHEEKK